MRIEYVIGKPWVASSRRHLVRIAGNPSTQGRCFTVTACGRELVGWVGPVLPVVGTPTEIDCKACQRTEAGRALPAAIAIEREARAFARDHFEVYTVNEKGTHRA